MRRIIWFVIGGGILGAAVYLAATVPQNTGRTFASAFMAFVGAWPVVIVLQRWLGPARNSEATRAAWSCLEELVHEELVHRHSQSHDALAGTLALELKIHIWQVPQLYRFVFRFCVRNALRRFVDNHKLEKIARFRLRPRLDRVACAGLPDKGPTNVPFRKGRGVIGCCVEANIFREPFILDAAARKYKRLLALSEADWNASDDALKRGLTLKEARLLAAQYGKVIAEVVRSETGEAIGCVTMSIGPNVRGIDLLNDDRFINKLHALAASVANNLKLAV